MGFVPILLLEIFEEFNRRADRFRGGISKNRAAGLAPFDERNQVRTVGIVHHLY